MATVGEGIRRKEGKRGTRAGGGGRKARHGRGGAGRTKAGERDLLPRIYCYYPEGEKHSSGAAYVCGVVRLSDARTSVYIYVYIYVYTCSQNIHGRVHVTWISWIRKLDVSRLLATAVCPTSALCRVSMHYALRN